MIRCIEPKDLDQIREIHSKHFGSEFDFPNFMDYICAFVVEDERE